MARKIYRSLLFVCAVYFIAVAIAHQAGVKLPMVFVFYDIPSERYQDLIISFLSFGWAMLFGIGFFDSELRMKIQVPILIAGAAAICGLIRARLEIQSHNEIDFEIASLAVLLLALLTAYIAAVREIRSTGK
jgi:hypothetical protein